MLEFLSTSGQYAVGALFTLSIIALIRAALTASSGGSGVCEVDAADTLRSYRARQHLFTGLIYAFAGGLWIYHDAVYTGQPLDSSTAIYWLTALLGGLVFALDVAYIVKAIQRGLSNQLKPELLQERALKSSMMTTLVGNLKYHPLFSGATLAHANLVLLFILTPMIMDFGVPVQETVNEYCLAHAEECEASHITYSKKSGEEAGEPQLFYKALSAGYQYELLENIIPIIVSKYQDDPNTKSLEAEIIEGEAESVIWLTIFKLLIVGLLLSFVLSLFSRRKASRELYHALNSEIINHLEYSDDHAALYEEVRQEMVPFFKEQLTSDPSLAELLFRLNIESDLERSWGKRLTELLWSGLERLFIKPSDRLSSHPLTKSFLISVLGDAQLVRSEFGSTLFNEYVDEGTTKLLERDVPQADLNDPELVALYQSALAYLSCSPDDVKVNLNQLKGALKDADVFGLERALLSLSQPLHPRGDLEELFLPTGDEWLSALLKGLHARRQVASEGADPLSEVLFSESLSRCARVIELFQAEGRQETRQLTILRRTMSVLQVMLSFVGRGDLESISMVDHMLKLTDDQNDIVGPQAREALRQVICDQLTGAIKAGGAEEVNGLTKLLSLLGAQEAQTVTLVADALKAELDSGEGAFNQRRDAIRALSEALQARSERLPEELTALKEVAIKRTPALMSELGARADEMTASALKVSVDDGEYSSSDFIRGVRAVYNDQAELRRALLRQGHILYLDVQALLTALNEGLAAQAAQLCAELKLSGAQELNSALAQRMLTELMMDQLQGEVSKRSVIDAARTQLTASSKERAVTFATLTRVMRDMTGELSERLEQTLCAEPAYRKLLICAQPSRALTERYVEALHAQDESPSEQELSYLWCFINQLFVHPAQEEDEREVRRALLMAINKTYPALDLVIWKLALAPQLSDEHVPLTLSDLEVSDLAPLDELCTVEVSEWLKAYKEDPTGKTALELFEGSSAAPDQLLVQVMMEDMLHRGLDSEQLTGALRSVSRYFASLVDPILWDDYRRWVERVLSELDQVDHFEALVRKLAHGGVRRNDRFKAYLYADRFIERLCERLIQSKASLTHQQLQVLNGFVAWIPDHAVSGLGALIMKMTEKNMVVNVFNGVCTLISNLPKLSEDLDIQEKLHRYIKVGPRGVAYYKLVSELAGQAKLTNWRAHDELLSAAFEGYAANGWPNSEMKLFAQFERELNPNLVIPDAGLTHLAGLFSCEVDALGEQSLERLIKETLPAQTESFLKTGEQPPHGLISAVFNTVQNGIARHTHGATDESPERLKRYKALKVLIDQHLTEAAFSLLSFVNSDSLLNLHNFRLAITRALLPVCATMDWSRTRAVIRSILTMDKDYLYLEMIEVITGASAHFATYEDASWLSALYQTVSDERDELISLSGQEGPGDALARVMGIAHNLQRALERAEGRWPLVSGLFTSSVPNPLNDLSAAPMFGALSVEAKYSGEHIAKAFEAKSKRA